MCVCVCAFGVLKLQNSVGLSLTEELRERVRTMSMSLAERGPHTPKGPSASILYPFKFKCNI